MIARLHPAGGFAGGLNGGQQQGQQNAARRPAAQRGAGHAECDHATLLPDFAGGAVYTPLPAGSGIVIGLPQAAQGPV